MKRPGSLKALWTFALIILLVPVQAQNVGALGAFRQEDLDMKTCSFDPDAAAVYLDYHGASDFDDRYQLVTEYHIRLKILKESAIDEGDVIIPFYHKDDFELINHIEGTTISPDANGHPVYTKLDNKSIFTKKENELYSTIRLAFPNVKVGSIIDYRYTSVMKSYGGLEKWEFQHHFPVVNSSFYLVILPNIEFGYSVQKQPNYQVDMKSFPDKGAVLFKMSNLPGFPDESYMDSRDDYIHRIDFQLSKTSSGKKYMQNWDQVAREFWSDKSFGRQLDEKLPDTKSLLAGISPLPTPLDRMRALYQYLTRNFNWNGIESKFSMDGLKKVWEKKTGSSGDLNLLLINLLQQFDIPAEPMLVSRRSHGKVHTNIPFADQFSTVMAYVELDGRKYILDVSQPMSDFDLFPLSVVNTTGLLVRKKTGELFSIVPPKPLVITTNLSLTVGPEEIIGEGAQYCMGYARHLRLKEWASSAVEYKKEYFEGAGNLTLTDFDMMDKSADSLPLEQKFKFRLPTPQTGDYLFIPLDLVTGMDQANPFVANNRFSDINFGYKQSYLVNLTINIPDGYKLESLPKGLNMTNPEKSIMLSRAASQTPSGLIMVRFELKVDRSTFHNGEYDMIRQFYNKIYELHAEKIALKKG